MVFETIYLVREAVRRAEQNVVYIPIESLRNAIKALLEEGIAIYPVNSITNLDEDLKEMQKQSILAVKDGKVMIYKEDFLCATQFVEKQEELLKDDKYASTIFAKLKQKAQQIQLLQG
jgi:predicted Fe-Mo cluster-binding NifX family protein